MKNRPLPLTIRVQEQSPNEPSPQKQHPFVSNHNFSSGIADSEEDRSKLQQSGPIGNVVQFEEFVPQQERQNNQQENGLQDSSVNSFIENEIRNKPKKKFMIDIPREGDSTIRFKNRIDSQESQDSVIQPPAPSNKKWSKNRTFVFPSFTPEQIPPEKDESINEKVSNLQKSFDRERQQFYRQKSRLQKELLVKDGQIEILQKTLTNILGNESQSSINQNQPSQYESKLLEKDKQIESHINKINEMNQQLSSRAQELIKLKNECTKLTYENQTLSNKLYVLQYSKTQTYLQPQFSLCSEQPSSSLKKDEGLSLLEKRLDLLSHNRKQLEDRSKPKATSCYERWSYIPTRENLDTSKESWGFFKKK